MRFPGRCIGRYTPHSHSHTRSKHIIITHIIMPSIYRLREYRIYILYIIHDDISNIYKYDENTPHVHKTSPGRVLFSISKHIVVGSLPRQRFRTDVFIL